MITSTNPHIATNNRYHTQSPTMSIHEEYVRQWKQIWHDFAIRILKQQKSRIEPKQWGCFADDDQFLHYVCYILANPNATAELVRTYYSHILPDFKMTIASNPAYSMDDIFNKTNGVFLDEKGVCGITLNPNFTIDVIKQHPHFNWNWYSATSNPNTTLDIIENNRDLKWDMNDMSSGINYNPNVTMDFILKHIGLKWDFHLLAKHPNITMDVMLKYPQHFNNMDFYAFPYCQNPNVTYEDLCKSGGCELDVEELCKNLKLDCLIKFIANEQTFIANRMKRCKTSGKKYFERPVDWRKISENPHITMDFILQNKHRINPIQKTYWWETETHPDMFDVEYITRNSAISMKHIIDNPEIPWSYRALFANPNLTFEMMNKYYDKMDVTLLLHNPLTFVKNAFIGGNTKNTLLLFIYEFYGEKLEYGNDVRLSSCECVFRDNYMLSVIGKF